MLVSDLGYSDFLGRLAIGRVLAGTAKGHDSLVRIDEENRRVPLRVTRLQVYEGLKVVDSETAHPGDIVVVSGLDEVKIGDTICSPRPKGPAAHQRGRSHGGHALHHQHLPLAGREGKYVQSARIRDRLFKETLLNVAIRVEESEERDSFIVKGRGEFQMAILIETMRREGFELAVGRPEVIYRMENGVRKEPVEHLFIDCEESFTGVVTEKLSIRKGRMKNLVNHGSGRVRLEFTIPSRGLIGYRAAFLTATKGTGIMNSYFLAICRNTGAIFPRASPVPSWPTARAWACPMPCSIWSRAAGSFCPPGNRSTRA
jgi:GTP-binding protein